MEINKVDIISNFSSKDYLKKLYKVKIQCSQTRQSLFLSSETKDIRDRNLYLVTSVKSIDHFLFLSSTYKQDTTTQC